MYFKFYTFILVLTVCTFSLFGCDNSIQPFSEDTTYSIHGLLSTSNEVQFVRISDLSVPLPETDSSRLDVDVELINENNGYSESLRDSIIAFEDEGVKVFTHNFWTDKDIKSDTKYRVSVKKSGREVVSATTVTPPVKEPKVNERDGNCLTNYVAFLQGVNDERLITIELEVRYNGQWHKLSQSKNVAENGVVGVSFVLENALEPLIPSPDPDPSDRALWPRCLELGSDTVKVVFTQRGPNWFEEAPADSSAFDLLDSKDVVGGPGFFRSLGRTKVSVTVDTSEILSIEPFNN